MSTLYSMEQTMRWYGPHDRVQLNDIRQAGVTGIVTALHEIPVGEVWSIEAIKARQDLIREHGMEWTVIESLPVHEDIKRRKGDYERYIINYKKSLENLASCGLFGATHWLCSEASKFVIGSIVNVDEGFDAFSGV